MKVHQKVFILSFFFVSLLFCNNQVFIKKLEKQSMLYQAAQLDKLYSGRADQWQIPFALPQPKKICKTASVWFSSYSLSTISKPGETILQTLSNEKLWDIFETIGIEAIHTGPMKRAGGLSSKIKYIPSVYGGFDRISYDIDPLFGTKEQYIELVNVAEKHHAIVLGDVIPGHTGFGADFQLAIRNYKDYPGLYHMIEIEPEDWFLLPPVKLGNLTVNLPLKTVELLKKKGYIVGRLQHIFYYNPKYKISNWDATKPITGVDGKKRRWVYLHFFKSGQPSLNWLDPSFASQRLISGDIIESIYNLKNSGIRLNANAFLGIEPRKHNKLVAWSDGHPLAILSTNIIGMLTRKMGGFVFQTLDSSLEEIEKFSQYGADLSYDFMTRTAYCNALINEDASFLCLIMRLILNSKFPLYRFIHVLQNHNQIDYLLISFDKHPKTFYEYKGKKILGQDLRQQIMKNDLTKITGNNAPYNLINAKGPCTTMVGLCAAALRIKDLFTMDQMEKKKVQKAHLLLAFFNAMQPGIFSISGWDIIGAYPVQASSIKNWSVDHDNRWAVRGAFDLLDSNPKASLSSAQLPKALSLYGSLCKQLKNPHSFISELKKILHVRKTHNIPLGELIHIFQTEHPALYAVVFRLPYTNHLQMTVLNFSQKTIVETLSYNAFKNTNALNLMTSKIEEKDFVSKKFTIKIPALEGRVILFRPKITDTHSNL